jgi:hypothetical protein
MVSNNECLYKVPVRLKTRDLVWDPEARLIEFNELRAWLDELTEWQPNMYDLRFHSSGRQCIAWFADERHAMLCALRWT